MDIVIRIKLFLFLFLAMLRHSNSPNKTNYLIIRSSRRRDNIRLVMEIIRTVGTVLAIYLLMRF